GRGEEIPRPQGYGRKASIFVWPVKGRVTTYFGTKEQKRHLGIDIKAPTGTPVVAARAGKVIYSGSTLPGYGNVIIIEHDRDFSTVYAHNSVNLVQDGIMVQKNQIIAYVGNTGRSTAPHLHFELRRRGRAENPLAYLPR
ncbi:MAG: M23 family metallopeptidase, partial [bacterium]